MTQRCANCGFWRKEQSLLTPTGKFKRNATAKCLWTAALVWPDSVAEDRRRVPDGHWMTPDAGKTCPTWKPIEEPQA